ncbi:MAG: hypothetical protein ISS79_02070 [Phycisphaerae bacterium]|nr:hypothetical protein [Phycisphaerae bacterium]
MTQVWQIAAGEPARNYADLFLRHDIMFLGPGRDGPYDEEVYRKVIEQGRWTKQKIRTIERFVMEVKAGDIVLLRNGKQVVSIGVAAEEEYEYNEAFDDVLGWDLQHTRRVIWQHHLIVELKQIQKESPLYGNVIGPMSMFTAVKKRRILDQLQSLFGQCQSRPLKPSPEKLPEPLSLEELGEQLFSKGLPNDSVERVILAIQRQRRLAKWYDECGRESIRPKEHEVVAHMILPLMLALGWAEQLLAVEWRKIDLAGFSHTPTIPENCCLVCEAKGLERALEEKVFDQAVKYAEGLKPNNCGKILLTDGVRLYLYQRKEDGKWTTSPDGYLNVKSIRTDHIAPAGTNAVETIMALTPARINREL